jgi:hypothetical protein
MKKQERELFQFIEPGALNKWPPILERIGLAEPILRGAAFGLTQLAESADDFFRGSFPIQAPYSPNDSIPLPWYDEYWSSTDGRTLKPLPIAEEIIRIAAHLGEINPDIDSPTLLAGGREPNLEKSYMQALAVETMLLVDGGLGQLLEARLVEAIPWITAAHQRIMDCSSHAHEILSPWLGNRDEIYARR